MRTELKTLLLAEDKAPDVELVLQALESDGLTDQMVVVSDGVEALEYLRREGRFQSRAPGQPVVIVLDIKMPRMGGLEALREIRRDPELQMLPVVVLSSSCEESDVIASYTLGANAYVCKPVVFAEFMEAIRTLGHFWALVNEPPVLGRHHGG